MFLAGVSMTPDPSIPAHVTLALGEEVVHVSSWSKGGMVAQLLLLALPLAGLSLPLIANGGEVLGVGIVFGVLAAITYALAYLSWQKRLAVVTTRNVLFVAGLSKTVRAIPLEQINQVTVAPGLVTVRTGSILNTLLLRVTDAEVLAEKIEQARQVRT